MLRYNSYRSYLKKKFGKPVLKIPVNAGFSCPNRDGTKSVTGCTFCDNRSFSPVANNQYSILSQITDVIKRSGKTYELFIPYLQPFSNTYGSVDRLRRIYEPLITVPGVCGLAIGTRPDCFSDEIIEYLYDLSGRVYLSIEIGLQSGIDRTLTTINRGHTVADFIVIVERLARLGIETVAHCMLGLPGELEQEMLYTAKLCASLPLSGVKIHQLMIIQATVLESAYWNGLIKPFTLEQYAGILCKFIMHIRPDQHIHRLVADSKRAYGLIAPLWCEKKNGAMKFITDYMERNNVVQGAWYVSAGMS